jgi:hypothetical protein
VAVAVGAAGAALELLEAGALAMVAVGAELTLELPGGTGCTSDGLDVVVRRGGGG